MLRAMVTVTVQGDELVFRTSPRRFYVGPREVRVPAAHVVDVRREAPPRPIIAVSWRNRGLWVPGRTVLGRYRIRGREVFYDVRPRDLDDVVRVDLRDEDLDGLFVEVEHPDAVVALVREAAS